MNTRVALAIFILAAHPGATWGAGDAPHAPCGPGAAARFAPLGAPANIRRWRIDELPPAWRNYSCPHWRIREFAALVELAGRIGDVPDSRQLLRRLGVISELRKILYWSHTRKKWRRLLNQSVALEGPDASLRRADFTVADLKPGRDLFSWQKENSLASGVIILTRFQTISSDRIVFDQVNVTGSRLLGIPVLNPREVATIYHLEREDDGIWTYYSLTRFGRSRDPVSDTEIASMVNRSVAFYRYIGALPMKREPPGAP